MLNRDVETSSKLKRKIADYANVPPGKRLKLLRNADEIFAKRAKDCDCPGCLLALHQDNEGEK